MHNVIVYAHCCKFQQNKLARCKFDVNLNRIHKK